MVDLGSGRTAKMVSAGAYHTCAILDDDTLKCWGKIHVAGVRRRHVSSPEATAVDLGSGRTAKTVSAGDIHVPILDDDTLVLGSNGNGQLGIGG